MNPSTPHPAPARIALITGSSSGFGLLTALTLAQQGFTVIATMRDLNRRQTLEEQAVQQGTADRIHCLQLDVTSEQSIHIAVQTVLRQYGSIDVLVNNAGYAAGGFIEHVPMQAWRDQLETNVFGLIAVTRAVLPAMRERRSGIIINISSVSGLVAFPGYAPYATSKFAIEGFSESLRHELSPFGVKVVLVEPGSYRTDIWGKGLDSIHTAPDSPYQTQLEAVLRYSRHSAEHAPHPRQVAELIGRIVNRRHPRLRYPIGQGSGLLGIARRLLPWSWLEWIIRQATK